MKIGKKLIALFLGIVMVMSLLPMTAFAEGESDALTETAEVAAEDTGETITYKPTITWQRTKELVYSETGLRGLYAGAKTDYEYVSSSTSNKTTTYTAKYDWDFATISEALNKEDIESTNVWDYGKTDTTGNSLQYTNSQTTTDDTSIVPQDGIFAATWNNRSYTAQKVTDNKKSYTYEEGQFDDGHAKSYTVRKFSGTFAWPDGYDLTSNIELVSKNDSNYSEIYNAVAADADLTASFGGKKVIAVNDDMYVFIYKEGTELNNGNYKDYLAFWTGTAGKGVWSWENSQPQDNNWGNAWQQTVPATFNGEYALRAFHSIKPNLDNVKATSTDTTKADRGVLTNTAMNQSGGWYAFADGNAISTVLNNQYKKDVNEGDTFHIDIYCFDTDKVGGMDELELVLTKAAPTQANVTVRYWLNTVGTDPTNDDNFLDSTIMTGQEIGSSITLSGGTAVNQLNYKKADAIAKNNSNDVADGVQTNQLVVKANSDENIIDVVYYPAGQKIVNLYAGENTVQYNGSAHTVKNVTIKENGYSDIKVSDSVTTKDRKLNDNNTVVNITAQKTETLPGIYAVNFTAASFVKSSSGQPLSNYTVIQHPGKLTITYTPSAAVCTYDFGVTNSYTGVLEDVETKAQSITVPADCDYVTVDKGNNTITYTPQNVNTGETVTLTLTYEGGYTCTKDISFYPATNVLYEENFMTNNGTNGNWATEGTNADTTTVTDNEDSVYGYTDVYEGFNELSNGGALKATLNLDGNRRVSTSDAVTFTFTGTGFDLISECGTNTGMLVAGIKDKSGNAVKAFIVDTYFCGDDEIITGTGILDYQVPVIRDMDLPYGTYTVTVYGYLTDASGASVSTQSSRLLAAAQAMSTANSAVDADTILSSLGMSEYLDTDVSVSFMDDNSVLNGGTGAATAQTKTSGVWSWLKSLFSGRAAVQSVSNDNSDINVYLDAFRVYQPLEDESNYTGTEKGLKYGSFYDYVVGSAQDIADGSYGAVVYMEYDGEQDIAVIKEYKKQGPQNEIYLSTENYVGFVLNGYTGVETVMVSAKAVQGEARFGYMTSDFDCVDADITLSATEMYYDVTEYVQEHIDDTGAVDYYYLILGNISEEGTTLLALSGIKLAKDITPEASDDLASLIKYDKGSNTFDPESFDVKYTASVKVGKKTALNVKTSLDVDHIAVYSAEDLSVEVKNNVLPNNQKAVANGKAKLYSFNVSVKIEENGENIFYVVAYDSDGNASNPVAVTINGK